jgi:D-tyrosyl-tRNA(Tyr) deacylase
MRAVVQRVSQSSVSIKGEIVGKIGLGMTILLGVAQEDTKKDADYLSDKIVNMRIFEDSDGKMNLSLKEIGGAALIISQFTLLADCRKGRRPSFIQAAEPEKAYQLYSRFITRFKNHGINVQTGRFRAMMKVAIINEGPVTFIIDSV